MNIFSLLPLLVASAPASASSTLSRGSIIQGQDELSSNRHRHLLQDSSCNLFRKCVTYAPTEDYPNGRDEHSWACELSEQDTKRLNVQFVDIVESSSVAAVLANATSGASFLTMSEAFFSDDDDEPRIYIPENTSVEVHNGLFGRDGAGDSVAKIGPSTTGKLTTLVIRVIDGDNISPDASVYQLKNDVFDNDTSLKTQNEACSYGKLKIKPFTGKTPNKKEITNGIVDVKMDYVMSSLKHGYFPAAMEAANEQLGDLGHSMFDLVMFCFPPSDEGFIAFAYINWKYSAYNNEMCGFVQVQMHEVGHNIGLAHSGQPGEGEYGDSTGVMGSTPLNNDRSMCYNPQKNYQLGWYDDKAETINPLDGAGRREFILNGVSDYMMNDDALIVLRLEQVNKVQDYYVGFNRAEGINKDTYEDRNMVTIVRKESGAPDEYGKSLKLASLEPGDRYVINDFDGQRDVQIKFLGLENGDATIEVIDFDDGCEDEKKRFKRKENGRKKTCKFYAKKNKCDEKILTGNDQDKYIFEVCEKSCDRCGA